MANLRFKALEFVNSRQPILPVLPSNKVSDYYVSNVYGIDAMKATISA